MIVAIKILVVIKKRIKRILISFLIRRINLYNCLLIKRKDNINMWLLE